MNPYQLSVFCAVKVQSIINNLGTFFHADFQSGDNNLHVVLPILKCCIVLYFRRCSKTAENCFLTILNLTLSVLINDHGRLTEPCAWAGATSGQVENQSVLAKFGVAFGEVQHGGWVADELIMGQDRPIILPQWTVPELAHGMILFLQCFHNYKLDTQSFHILDCILCVYPFPYKTFSSI